MSASLTATRRNVNLKLRNYRGRVSTLTDPVVDESISSVMQMVGGELGLDVDWVIDAITTAAGVREYELPSNVENHHIAIVRMQLDGITLRKASPDDIEKWRSGTSPSVGRPYAYALTESTPGAVGNQKTKIILGPTPDAVYKYDILRSASPDTLSDEADDIPFSNAGVRAVEWLAASQLAAVMTIEDLAAAGLSQNTWKVYEKNGERSLLSAKHRSAERHRAGRMRVVTR